MKLILKETVFLGIVALKLKLFFDFNFYFLFSISVRHVELYKINLVNIKR